MPDSFSPVPAGTNAVVKAATARLGSRALTTGTYSKKITGVIVDDAGAVVSYTASRSENPEAVDVVSFALAPGSYPIFADSITVVGNVILILG